MTNVYTATCTNEGVPAWDIRDSLSDFVIGFMTDFPGEGPMATVRLSQGEEGVTVKAKSRHACLLLAGETYAELRYVNEAQERNADHQEYIEDEDGELAYMRHVERKSEEWAMRDDMQEPVW